MHHEFLHDHVSDEIESKRAVKAGKSGAVTATTTWIVHIQNNKQDTKVCENYQYNGTHIITLQKTAHGTIYELTKGGG